MFRATALLIVMALAGWPTSSLVCELWCHVSAKTQDQAVRCHDPATAVAGGPHVASVHACGEAAAIAPFVAGAKRSGLAAALEAALGEPVAMPGALGYAAAWSCVRQLSGRRRPSLQTVLRI